MPQLNDRVSAGDVVQLASGGPKMTVERIGTAEGGGVAAHCVWFWEGDPKTAVFNEAALKKVEV